MLTLTVLGYGLFAGLTIFISIPAARMRSVSRPVRAFLGALTAGILLFLFWDVLNQALGVVTNDAFVGNIRATSIDASIVLGTFLLGFLGLTLFERYYRGRNALILAGSGEPPDLAASPVPVSPFKTMDIIAVGIGFHNFAEGLAIGAVYVGGGLGMATVLFVGFALHNSTEGFGVVGPALAAGLIPSWRRLIALGLVAGGPTFLGTLVGSSLVLPLLSLGFLGVAAGAILYVVIELVAVAGRAAMPHIRALGIFAGFALGLLTDLVVTAGHV